jgi:hypothetical protein
MILLSVIALIKSFIRYDPKIDLVINNNKYTVLLWYNSYTCDNEFVERKFVKLIEI